MTKRHPTYRPERNTSIMIETSTRPDGVKVNLHIVGETSYCAEYFLVSAWARGGDGPETTPSRRFPLTLTGEKAARTAFKALVANQIAA